ncbi:S8 family serine peptidase [Lysobacter enzymogenes]|uniref:Peptidase S8 n=1 Tax=Lysobacter enzymogenes TaxID=69 RepID=A0A3N2RF75_LYSEN|nr:S8 family serine peptidase [Lysobacter enzymogenes]ROU06059.1 peptidase S8 [Lysobacter enzymogenes]
MKQSKLACALSLGLAVAAASGAAAAQDGAKPRVWVKFKPAPVSAISPTLSTDPQAILDQIASIVARSNERMSAQVRGIDALMSRRKLGRATLHHRFEGLDRAVFTLPSRAALDSLRSDPSVESVEIDQPRYLLQQDTPGGIDQIQASQVWDADGDGALDAGAPTGAGIKVCVIDSGLKRSHEDLAGIAIGGSANSFGPSWDTDTCGHGTHVAGTIAAAHNDKGVVGVSPGKVSLHIVKVFDGAECKPVLFASDNVAAIKKCEAAGAKVVNMSLGGPSRSNTEESELQQAAARGTLVVAAAGNYGDKPFPATGQVNPLFYPASYPSVVSVAAVDANSKKAGFSEFNSQIDLAAPGVGVRSLGLSSSEPLRVGSSTFPANTLTGSAKSKASAVWVDGGLCKASSAAFSGKIVLCQRGEINFVDKVANAKSGGALGVAIYNNADGEFAGSMSPASTIPATGISKASGEAILAGLAGQTMTVNGIANVNDSSYATMDGTSMASPHVAGAAAVVWSARPNATAQQVREALFATAKDIDAAGRDDNTGWGLVQVKAAIEELKRVVPAK